MTQVTDLSHRRLVGYLVQKIIIFLWKAMEGVQQVYYHGGRISKSMEVKTNTLKVLPLYNPSARWTRVFHLEPQVQSSLILANFLTLTC